MSVYANKDLAIRTTALGGHLTLPGFMVPLGTSVNLPCGSKHI